ncbi:hypothetical protein PODOV061v2_0039 [Vibrio phage 172P1]|nr:hypothetical protein PODOV061v2_0039 [Vibrio phage 172P1]
MKKAKFSGFETLQIGDLTIVTDLKERQGVGLALHDFGTDTEYVFKREEARALYNFIGNYLLMEVIDE